MIDCMLSVEELMFLNRLIGIDFCGISYNVISTSNNAAVVHFNVLLEVSSEKFGIRNELELISWDDDEEEIARFHIDRHSGEKGYEKKTDDIEVMLINESIEDIVIVRDRVVSRQPDGRMVFDMLIDDAIVFKFASFQLVLYKGWALDEFIYIVKTDDYRRDIRSVEKIEEEYSDDEDHEYSAKCERTEISLREWKPEGTEA